MPHVLGSVCIGIHGLKKKEPIMPSLIPDVAAFEKRLAGLPTVKQNGMSALPPKADMGAILLGPWQVHFLNECRIIARRK
jgi:hypothetical protein